ncbi:hypothetical protein HK104_009026, partial [Borealophlyctis nickersoniae]
MIDTALEKGIRQFMDSNPAFMDRVQKLRSEVEGASKGRIKLPPYGYDPRNPFTLEHFLEDLSIPGDKSLLVDRSRWCKRSDGSGVEDYVSLRTRQDKAYAMEHVKEGVNCFQRDELDKAMHKYATALSLDPKCTDALVARGCVYVKQNNYEEAIEDFKKALEIDPRHANAFTYLKKTQDKLAEIEREKESAAKGEFLLAADYDPKAAARKAIALGDPKPKPSHQQGAMSSRAPLNGDVRRQAIPSPPAEDPRPAEKKHKEKKSKKKSKKRRRRRSASRDDKEDGGRSGKRRRRSEEKAAGTTMKNSDLGLRDTTTDLREVETSLQGVIVAGTHIRQEAGGTQVLGPACHVTTAVFRRQVTETGMKNLDEHGEGMKREEVGQDHRHWIGRKGGQQGGRYVETGRAIPGF